MRPDGQRRPGPRCGAISDDCWITEVVARVLKLALRSEEPLFGAGSASSDLDQGTRFSHGWRIPQLYPQAMARLRKR